MKIYAKLIGLRPRLEPASAVEGWYTLSLAENACARQLAAAFGLDADAVIMTRSRKPCPPGACLLEGDRVLLLTMAEGG